jgi:hypothetical protein
MTTRLEILGENGEWHEVPGVTSVEFHQEQPDVPPEISEAMQRLGASMERAIKAELRRLIRKGSTSPRRIP